MIDLSQWAQESYRIPNTELETGIDTLQSGKSE